MKVLALEKDVPGITGEQFEPFLKDEAFKVWELYQSGVIREIYFRGDRRDAVLILECDDVHAAEQYLGTLPLVRQGLITFEIIPLTSYSGFSRLFGDSFKC